MITRDSPAGRGGELECMLVAPRVVQVETHGYAGGWLRQSGLCRVLEVRKARWWVVEGLGHRNGPITLEEERSWIKVLVRCNILFYILFHVYNIFFSFRLNPNHDLFQNYLSAAVSQNSPVSRT